MFLYKKRHIHGLLLLDKPRGFSSNYVLQQVKCIFNAKKAGYSGTLDPLATGILPICFGETTKFSHYLTESDKKYHVIAKLGETTSTSDSDGIIIKKRPVRFTTFQLIQSIQALTGIIKQIPSMYSAIKYNGIPLYKYARQGLFITRQVRQVSIYKIDLINQKNNFIELSILCSKGTYIRTLIEDLGENLGCGAHVIFLRRIQVSSYSCSKLINIFDLYRYSNTKNITHIEMFKQLDKFLMPIDSPISFLPKIFLSMQQALNFKLGQKILFISTIKDLLVRVAEVRNKKFLGLGKIDRENFLIPHRLVSSVTN